MSPILYLQAGAFGVAGNATQLADRLRRSGFTDVQVLPPDALGAAAPRSHRTDRQRRGASTRSLRRLSALGVDARLVSP